jgi:hypothetical protein
LSIWLWLVEGVVVQELAAVEVLVDLELEQD